MSNAGAAPWSCPHRNGWRLSGGRTGRSGGDAVAEEMVAGIGLGDMESAAIRWVDKGNYGLIDDIPPSRYWDLIRWNFDLPFAALYRSD
jgi:hypothetical protein